MPSRMATGRTRSRALANKTGELGVRVQRGVCVALIAPNRETRVERVSGDTMLLIRLWRTLELNWFALRWFPWTHDKKLVEHRGWGKNREWRLTADGREVVGRFWLAHCNGKDLAAVRIQPELAWKYIEHYARDFLECYGIVYNALLISRACDLKILIALAASTAGRGEDGSDISTE
jgi:hypothetical protein